MDWVLSSWYWYRWEACSAEMGRKKNNKRNEAARIDEEQE
jgi:hypothetical protein